MPAAPQKITVIAHALRAGGGIGVGQNLIASLCGRYPQAHYQISVPEGLGYEQVIPAGVQCECISYQERFGLVGRWFFDEVTLRERIRRFKPDVVLCLGNLGLTWRICPQVLLIQDAHLFYPEVNYGEIGFLERWSYRYRKRRLSRDLRGSACVLCQTEVARDRIRHSYGHDGEIVVLRNAISPGILATRAAQSRTGRFAALAGRFKLLYLTRYYPHKNLELLLELFRRFRGALDGVVVYLTIAPDQHPGARRLLAAIKRERLSSAIVNLGPLAQSDIAACYRAVDALIMPTKLESFSGTYLEAMALDCPIATSDLDFARAICGDAAIYFDPWSVDSLYAAVQELLTDSLRRRELVEHGRRVLHEGATSWHENAALLQKVLQATTRKAPTTADNIGVAPGPP